MLTSHGLAERVWWLGSILGLSHNLVSTLRVHGHNSEYVSWPKLQQRLAQAHGCCAKCEMASMYDKGVTEGSGQNRTSTTKTTSLSWSPKFMHDYSTFPNSMLPAIQFPSPPKQLPLPDETRIKAWPLST